MRRLNDFGVTIYARKHKWRKKRSIMWDRKGTLRWMENKAPRVADFD